MGVLLIIGVEKPILLVVERGAGGGGSGVSGSLRGTSGGGRGASIRGTTMDGKDYLIQRIADHARHAILPPSDLGLLMEKVETTASKTVVQTDDRLRIGPSSVFRFKSDLDAREVLDLVNAYFEVRV